MLPDICGMSPTPAPETGSESGRQGFVGRLRIVPLL